MLEHDDVRRIVDADGPKFAKDVLAEQAVETYPQNLLEFIQIHQGDALAGPHVVGEGEAHRQEHGFARHAGSAAVALGAAQWKLHAAVGSYADDGVVGACIEKEGDAFFVDFAFDRNHRLHGTERDADRTRIRAIGHGGEQNQEQQQCAQYRPQASGISRHTNPPPHPHDRNASLKRWILMTMNRRLSTESRRFPPKHHPLLAGEPFPLHI